MQPENRDRLEKYREHYNRLVKDDSLNLSHEGRNEIVDVIRKEFNPGYTYMEWCGKCVADMVKYAFSELDKRPVDIIKVKL